MSDSTPEEERQRQDEGGVRAPSPLVHGRISSEVSEAEGPEEPIEFPSSAAHPKPLSVSNMRKMVELVCLSNVCANK